MTKIAIIAYVVDDINMMNAVKAAPPIAVCHEKNLNSGRKLGAPVTRRTKHAKLIKK